MYASNVGARPITAVSRQCATAAASTKRRRPIRSARAEEERDQHADAHEREPGPERRVTDVVHLGRVRQRLRQQPACPAA